MSRKKSTSELFDGLPLIGDLMEELSSGDPLEDDPVFVADYLSASFVEQVLQQMATQGVSKSELARRIGKNRAYVSRILNENVNFTLKTMAEVSIALGQRLDLRVYPANSESDTTPRSQQVGQASNLRVRRGASAA